MKSLEILTLPADRLPGEAVVALYFEDHRPLDGPAALLDWRLDGQLTRLLLDGKLSGRAGEHLLLQNNGKLNADWALLIGGGKWKGLCRDTYVSLLGHGLSTVRQAGFSDISVSVAPHEEAGADALAEAFAGLLEKEGQALSECRLSCMTL